MGSSFRIAITAVAGGLNSTYAFLHPFMAQFLWSKFVVRALENPVRMVSCMYELDPWLFHCGCPCCGSMASQVSWTPISQFCTHFWLNSCDLNFSMEPSQMRFEWWLEHVNWISGCLLVATPVVEAWPASWVGHKARIFTPISDSISVI